MGLTWTERVVSQRWVGWGADGRAYAMVAADQRGFEPFIYAHGTVEPDGEWLRGPWATPGEAMIAADRHVVACLDVEGARDSAVGGDHAATAPPAPRRRRAAR